MPDAKPQPPRLSWIRWSYAKMIADSRLPQVAAFIPAIGYALLWSDPFRDLLGSQTLLGPSIVPPVCKIRLLWWGAVLMTIGWFIYRFWCPTEVRRAGDSAEYVREQFLTPNTRRAWAAKERVGELIEPWGDEEIGVVVYGEFPAKCPSSGFSGHLSV